MTIFTLDALMDMLSHGSVQFYLLVLGWAISGCIQSHYRRHDCLDTCHERARKQRIRDDENDDDDDINVEAQRRVLHGIGRHARPAISALVLIVTWFYIVRFILSYSSNADSDALSSSYFDDAYRDVLRTPNLYVTSGQLLTWAVVVTVWMSGDGNCDVRYLVMGYLGAMGASFALWRDDGDGDGDDDENDNYNGDGGNGGGTTAGSGKKDGIRYEEVVSIGGTMRNMHAGIRKSGISSNDRRKANTRRTIPVSYALSSALALICIHNLRPCLLPQEEKEEEEEEKMKEGAADKESLSPALSLCSPDVGYGSFPPLFSFWLRSMHVVLVLPPLLCRLFPSQPSIDAALLYLCLGIVTMWWHVSSVVSAATLAMPSQKEQREEDMEDEWQWQWPFALPATDCQKSIFVDLVVCAVLTSIAIVKDSRRCGTTTGDRAPLGARCGSIWNMSTAAAATATATTLAAIVAIWVAASAQTPDPVCSGASSPLSSELPLLLPLSPTLLPLLLPLLLLSSPAPALAFYLCSTRIVESHRHAVSSMQRYAAESMRRRRQQQQRQRHGTCQGSTLPRPVAETDVATGANGAIGVIKKEKANANGTISVMGGGEGGGDDRVDMDGGGAGGGWCNLGLWTDRIDVAHVVDGEKTTKEKDDDDGPPSTFSSSAAAAAGIGYDEACERLARALGRCADVNKSTSVLCCGCGPTRYGEVMLYRRAFHARYVTGIDPSVDEGAESRESVVRSFGGDGGGGGGGYRHDDDNGGDGGSSGGGGGEHVVQPSSSSSSRSEDYFRVRMMRADVRDLSSSSSKPLFPRGIFDRILSLDNAYHYADKVRYLRDCHDMLPGGGKIGMTDLLLLGNDQQDVSCLPLSVRTTLRLMGVNVNELWTESQYRSVLVAELGYVDVRLVRIGNDVFAGWTGILPEFLVRHLDYVIVVATKPYPPSSSLLSSETNAKEEEGEGETTTTTKKKKVAIIGSGLAGLSAAHRITSSLYASNVDVAVLESNRDGPGLAAHTAKIVGGGKSSDDAAMMSAVAAAARPVTLVDVPARMAAVGYYDSYVDLLETLGLPTVVVPTDCSYYGEDKHGAYVCHEYGSSNWSNLWSALWTGGPKKLWRLVRVVSSLEKEEAEREWGGKDDDDDDEDDEREEKEEKDGCVPSRYRGRSRRSRSKRTVTFGDWLDERFGTNTRAMSVCRRGGGSGGGGGHEGEGDGHRGDCCEHYASDLPSMTCRDEPFLYILIGSICWMLSCTYDHLVNYPADVVLPYIRGLKMKHLGLFRKGQVVRVDPSIKVLEGALLYGVDEFRCGAKVIGVESSERIIDGVRYDAIICATEARAVTSVVKDAPPDVFDMVRYHPSTVFLHTDERLMPPRREDWKCWNVRQMPGRDGPELTFWLNRYYPHADFGADTNVFQTWSPLRDIDPEKVLKRSDFDRVVHTANTYDLVKRIEREQGKGGIYYAGSYCVYGMGLLEQALVSGIQAGDRVLKDLFLPDR